MARTRVAVARRRKESDAERAQRERRTQLLQQVQNLTMLIGSRPGKNRIPINASVRIQVSCTCPYCKEVQLASDILQNASESAYDITTQCTKCDGRYTPRILVRFEKKRIRLPWMCPVQTHDQLLFWAKNAPELDCVLLYEERLAVYWNAYNYGVGMNALADSSDRHDVVQYFYTHFEDEESSSDSE